MPTEVEVEHRSFTIDSWEDQRRTFGFSAGDATEARIRTFYYPYWTATAGDEILPVCWDTDGAILIALPERALKLTLEFKEPVRRRVSTLISIFAWGLIASRLVWLDLNKKR